MSYNPRSINVHLERTDCRKFILCLLLPLLLLPAAAGSCHYFFLLLPAVPIDNFCYRLLLLIAYYAA